MAENNLVKAALNKAMALCAHHEYCSSEIRSRLSSWGVGDDDSARLISVLIKEKFINDARYSAAFVKDKFNQNKWGKIKIAAHLRSKKISEETVQSALDEIDDEVYIKMIRDTIDSHRRFVKAKNRYDLKGKLLRFGLSKGFESNLLYDILNETDK
jgi:regulatory protein